jgi:hypothetical protein
MSVIFVAMGLFLVVFGIFIVECMTSACKNPHKKGIAKKLLAFVVLANLYVFIELIAGVQVSPILSLVHVLNVTLGIILLTLFCVFMYRNFTVHRDVIKFNTLLVWLTIIFATAALGVRFIEVMVGGEVMLNDVFCVTHCFAILLFSIFGNLMILDFIMNNREPVCAIDMPRGARLTAIGGK